MYEIKKSPIDGKGVFATRRISKRKKIGELTGTFLTKREYRNVTAAKRVHVWEYDNPNLDALHITNDLRFINHACTPNAFVRVLGIRVEVYARVPIRSGQEITVNYGPSTHHDGTLRCRCGCDNRYL